ncbi:hypothetical protein AQJ23_17370 [Streptomyces antibioticus]|nr:hypothetical protein AQJ23_17370 [Streptomyces antibioticus]
MTSSEVIPFIAEDAPYWFSDGSHQGIDEVRSAIERTFANIIDEVYGVRDMEWVVLTAEIALCRHRCAWTDVLDGEPRSGQGGRQRHGATGRRLEDGARASELRIPRALRWASGPGRTSP